MLMMMMMISSSQVQLQVWKPRIHRGPPEVGGGFVRNTDVFVRLTSVSVSVSVSTRFLLQVKQQLQKASHPVTALRLTSRP